METISKENETFMQAKFKMDSQGIEISGTEAFVESQIDKFKELIQSSYEKILERPLINPAVEPAALRRVTLEQNTLQNSMPEDAEYVEVKETGLNYENVFVNEGGKVQIIADVPGSTTAAIMINVILILMWAKMKQGIENVPLSDLRDACINYGRFDAANFSSHLNHNKKYFLILGEGKSRTAKLIRPGIKEAERLIEELNKK